MSDTPIRYIITPRLKGTCPLCATRHEKNAPCETRSIFYRVRFYRKHKFYPETEHDNDDRMDK